MVSLTTLAVAGLTVAAVYYYFFKNSNKKSPPGPWGLPILGNLLSLEPQLHLSFEKWGKKYGPVVGLRLGQFQAVILDDIKTIREAFNLPAFSGRPDIKLFNFLANGKHGLANSDGQEWVEQRRFTLRTLRDFGFGKKSMEAMIIDEVNEVIDWIKENDGKPVSMNRKFTLAVVNALMTIMAGKRYDQDDPKLKGMMDTGIEVFNEVSKSGLLWFFPKITGILPKFFGWEKLLSVAKPITDFFEEQVQEHVDSKANNPDLPDFAYKYLDEVENTKDPDSSFYKERGIKSLAVVLADLYGAGSGTTTTTLAWIILYLMTHPEIQSKLQEELDKVTGKTRSPCLADRQNTPYTEAVIQETLRFSSIIPFAVFHSTTEDVNFRGYFIPKDTLIIPNLHAVHHDEKTWGDPENFRPSRFLSEDGKTVKKSDSLIPFSVGKRVCVGEVLARDQIYLFLTNIFYKFRALPDPADPNPSLKPNGAFSLEAKPYTVVFKERH